MQHINRYFFRNPVKHRFIRMPLFFQEIMIITEPHDDTIRPYLLFGLIGLQCFYYTIKIRTFRKIRQ